MKRTQIYITEDQASRIQQLAEASEISKAEVIRRILDDALKTGNSEAESRAGILDTAGIFADYPDWPEWLTAVSGKSADERLDELGL